MGYQLGVDLGTTFTAAAVARDGRAEPVTLGTTSMAVPSVVYLGDGGLVVGHAAQRRATTDPSRVASEFKRRVGDPTPILVGGSPVAAELLMARLLAWVVGEVTGWEGGPPEALAVTHPANWGPYKLDLLTQAIRHVGLRADRLVPEPVAAATFYATQRPLAPGSVIAVYDLGGGTFDASVVRTGDGTGANAGEYAIAGQPDGIERLGGIDFDHAVLRYAVEAVGLDLDDLDPHDPGQTAALAQLREQCVLAKEALSAETAASIPVVLPGLYAEVRLTRTELEAMIRPALEETLVALRRTVASADLAPADLSAVLLVGGSSRIPLIAQLVTADLQRPIAVDARPKDAIALGAALAAAAAAPPAVRRPAPPPPAHVSVPVTGAAATSTAVPTATAMAPGDAPVPVLDPVVGASPAWAEPATAPAAPPVTRRPRPSRRLGLAVLSAALTVSGVLAWRTATDGADPATLATVTAGASHTCSLDHGAVECWGANNAGQTSPPEGVELTAISAGAQHTCGLDTDGTAVCWGDDDERQSSPPEGERYVDITAGENHTCGRRADETVRCWGDGGDGQRAPQGATRFTGISAGWDHNCGLRTDGTATCWGNDRGGVSSPPRGVQFTMLDAGRNHTCGVRTDGAADCWGTGDAVDDTHETQPPEGDRFSAVSAGVSHSCGVRTDGTVACWGGDEFGQSSPLDGRFVSISAGGVHTCGVRPSGSVECWGGLSSPAAGAG